MFCTSWEGPRNADFFWMVLTNSHCTVYEYEVKKKDLRKDLENYPKRKLGVLNVTTHFSGNNQASI